MLRLFNLKSRRTPLKALAKITAIALTGFLAAAPAWAEALRLGVSVSSKDAATQSFLRFFNTGGTDNTVDVALTDLTTGAVLSTWTSPAVPAGTAAQYAISTIEKAAAAPFNKPAFYVVTATPRFSGFAQSVLYKPSDGTLSNISGCDSGLAGPGTAIPYVHSSLLSSGFPSHLVISNTGTAAVAVTLGVYNETTGAKLGTYTTAPIAKSAALFVEVSDIEAQAKIKPAAGMYHYIVKVESPLTGFVQHLVENIQAGLYTDITSQCTLTATTSVASRAFGGNVVLGSPTSTSIRANVYAPDQTGTIYIAYGKVSGTYDSQTTPAALPQATPVEVAISNLTPNTRYYYRLYFRGASDSAFTPLDEYSFQTARPAGTSFTFTVQADSHLDENSDLNTYRTTLSNILADRPDFHVDLGDTFMTEKYSVPLSATLQAAPDRATVINRYKYERGNFGLITHSVPLFIANGNHDGELGWLLNGTGESLPVWATQARQGYFLNPTPDAFYSGDTTSQNFVGKRASWYSWTWGDALFVVLDPFWDTTVKTNSDGWVYTLGERQYAWLKTTLAASTAKFKFVFIHNLVGGLDGQMRGGIEAAPFFEWGGKNLDGTNGFAQKRPGWATPIHQLLVQYGVSVVFHGHDHIYAKQELDGIVYQEVPQPSARNTSSGANIAASYHYVAGTILSSAGHLRVTVAANRVAAEYVRSWQPASETAKQKNREIADSWSIAAP